MTGKKRSDAEREYLAAEIAKALASGQTVKDAARRLRISQSSGYMLVRDFNLNNPYRHAKRQRDKRTSMEKFVAAWIETRAR